MVVVTIDGQVMFVPPRIKTVHCEPVEDDQDHGDATDDDDHAWNDDAADGNGNGHGNATRNEPANGNSNEHDNDNDNANNGEDNHEWFCQFRYGSWVYDADILSLGLYETAVDTSSFKPDTRYEVVDTSATVETKFYPCCPEPYQDVLYEIHIRRN